MKKVFILVGLAALALSAHAQKFTANDGTIIFFSDAILEDIRAENKKVGSIFDAAKNSIAFSVPNNQFQFEKKLMQQHFNEKYMESEKYPRSTFTGRLEKFNAAAKGEQSVRAVGKLTIHGVTKDVEIPGVVDVKEGQLVMKSVFMVKLADYNIKIPQILWQHIAEQVEVTVTLTYKPQ